MMRKYGDLSAAPTEESTAEKASEKVAEKRKRNPVGTFFSSCSLPYLCG
jgi:hypothetical protein